MPLIGPRKTPYLLWLASREGLSRPWQGHVFCLSKHRTGPGRDWAVCRPRQVKTVWPSQLIRAGHEELSSNQEPGVAADWRWLARSVHRARRLGWPDPDRSCSNLQTLETLQQCPALQNVAECGTPAPGQHVTVHKPRQVIQKFTRYGQNLENYSLNI